MVFGKATDHGVLSDSATVDGRAKTSNFRLQALRHPRARGGHVHDLGPPCRFFVRLDPPDKIDER